jgi:hypothetical protein
MMHPDDAPVTYTAYLVRLWQENEEIPWRASAQSARTGEKLFFADLESLFIFLRAQTRLGPAIDSAVSGCGDVSQRRSIAQNCGFSERR